jgi:hypothetical protein
MLLHFLHSLHPCNLAIAEEQISVPVGKASTDLSPLDVFYLAWTLKLLCWIMAFKHNN